MHRRSLRPLLETLRTQQTTFRWGFPFRLPTSRNGKSAVLRHKDDLQHFCDTLYVPVVDFPDWRLQGAIPIPQRPERWRRVSSMSAKKKKGLKRDSDHGAAAT